MYKPIVLGVELPVRQVRIANRCDPEDCWWKHEVLRRKLQLCYAELAHKHREEVLALERSMAGQALKPFYRNQLDEGRAFELLSQALRS